MKSGFGKKIENWIGRDTVYPDNVLHFATVCENKGHSATFPSELPEWFIKLFSKKGDIVLDPFLGSGTTAIVAKTLERHYVGMELNKTYYKLAKENISKFVPTKIKKRKVKGKEILSNERNIK